MLSHRVRTPRCGGLFAPRRGDLKAACPDPTACAYGIAIASSERRRLAEGYELRLLDDAGNAAAAAAVAGSSKASGWLVDARGELGSDGNVIRRKSQLNVSHCGSVRCVILR